MYKTISPFIHYYENLIFPSPPPNLLRSFHVARFVIL